MRICSAVLFQLKGFGVLVPGSGPGPKVGFEGLDAAVFAALEQIACDVGINTQDHRMLGMASG